MGGNRVRDVFRNEDDDEQLHFSASVGAQSQLDDIRSGIALRWLLLMAYRSRAVGDSIGSSSHEMDQAIGRISERDGAPTGPPVQGGGLGRLKGVAREVPSLSLASNAPKTAPRWRRAKSGGGGGI